jgi:hypothetical protein
MTTFWMFLFGGDYGLVSVGVVIFVFSLFFCSLYSSVADIPSITSLLFISFLVCLYGISVVKPAKIPEYGTESQKSKMAYCIQQYMNTEHVGVETITHENLETIMIKCQERDKKNAPIQEEQLKNKQLQDGIRKVINENK